LSSEGREGGEERRREGERGEVDLVRDEEGLALPASQRGECLHVSGCRRGGSLQSCPLRGRRGGGGEGGREGECLRNVCPGGGRVGGQAGNVPGSERMASRH